MREMFKNVRDKFALIIRQIHPTTSYMGNYQKWLEKVTNIPREKYIN